MVPTVLFSVSLLGKLESLGDFFLEGYSHHWKTVTVHDTDRGVFRFALRREIVGSPRREWAVYRDYRPTEFDIVLVFQNNFRFSK